MRVQGGRATALRYGETAERKELLVTQSTRRKKGGDAKALLDALS